MDVKTPEEIFKAADEQTRQIVSRVLNVEREYLYDKKPHGIKDDLLKIFHQEISE